MCESSDLTPSQRALRGLITRVGSLSPEQRERVLAASEDLDDGNGLTTQQWHQVIDEQGC